MTEQEFYRVKVFSPVGIRDVVANGIGLVKEVYTRKDATRFQMEVTLEGKVTSSCEDFEYFLQLATSERRYDDARAVISFFCNGAWIVKWRARIEVRKGTFDYERKVFTYSFSLEGSSRDFESRKSDEFNLLELVSARLTTSAQYTPGLVYTNGVPLYNSLLAMLREIFAVTSVKSDFFQWNSTNSTYVIGHSDLLRRQGLFHKSDIVKASSPGYAPATILKMTLAELIDNLCKLYNLQYTLDAAGNFRIEHLSWYSRGTGLDLTVPKYEKMLIGTREFSYDEPQLYRLEKFKNPQSINADFVGVPIEYNNDFIQNLKDTVGHFTTAKEEEDVLIREVSWITDIDAVYGNLGSSVVAEANRDQDLDGVVLLALDSSGNIESVPGILGGTSPRNNNVNSWAILHEDYWKYGRLFEEGLMNKVQTAFTSLQRIKIRKKITIPFCCNETMNPEDQVVTEYGPAIIKKVSFDYYRGTAELELAYEDLEELTLAAPLAIDDIYATDINTALGTILSGKPSLIANDAGATSAYPETKSTLLGGSVVIDAAGHFTYTPPSGATGADLFEYIAMNFVGRLDIGAAKIIIKVANVYVHMESNDSVIALYPAGSGNLYIYKRTISYYEDPLLQVPLDLTGYGLDIYFTVTHNGVPSSGSYTASGFSEDVVNNVFSSPHTYSAVINFSAAYTIV